MLRKKSKTVTRRTPAAGGFADHSLENLDRRGFLKGSGLAAGALAAVTLTGGKVTRAKAASRDGAVKTVKSVCTHCSVGCTVVAEVSDGVWIGQEPGWDSPFNLAGAHCAKGASVREHAHGERRLKYPMKKEGGRRQICPISWKTRSTRSATR